jgi:ABC-type antimicrobial peptide transport system permease subunit
VWERRREFAVLRALGYSPQAIGAVVLLENVTLVCGGLFAGLGAAVVAVLPRIIETPTDIPWLSVGRLAVLVLVCGNLAGLVGLAAAVRAPLLSSLRSE